MHDIKIEAVTSKRKFASFIGANTIHAKDGTFLKIEHTEVSREACRYYRHKGTTAWQEYCKQEVQ